jgi:uncharacterized protein involved in outer membrane biogenesis
LLTIGLALLALVLGVLLYLAFGDLSRHKPRIEEFIAERTGRSFQIQGPFQLKVLPAVSVVAENVRFGNADWGTEQPMIDIGRFATVIDLWSLISGPAEIRSVELSDITVLLEKDAKGNANWVLQEPAGSEAEDEPADSGVTEVPAIIENGQLSNVRVTFRQPDKSDRVAVFNSFTISPGTGGLLAIAGDGALDDYAMALKGEIGPIDALTAGRDIRLAIDASVGNLSLGAEGGVGRLYPLDGADLRLKLLNPDLGTMLGNLQLPVVAEGTMDATVTLSDAGERTGLNVDATLGDIRAKVAGTLATLGLTDSELEFSATVGDTARLATAFGLKGLPQEELHVGGRLKTSRDQIGLEGLTAQLAGAEAKVDGSVPRSAKGTSTLRFEAAVDNIARLKEGLPEIQANAAGIYAGNRNGFEVRDLHLRLDQSELSGKAAFKRAGRMRIDAQLSSPRLDLTPFKKEKPEDMGKPKTADAARQDGGSKDEFVFRDEPLPLDKLQGTDAQVQLKVAELVLDAGRLADVSGALTLDQGNMSLDFQATGTAQGTIDGDVRLVPSQGGANLTIDVSIRDLRAGLLAPKDDDPSKAPPTNVNIDIRASGLSPRQMAAGANGKIVMTQEKGHVKSGVIDMLGSGVLSQLGSQLNPFSAKDPYTKLECTAAKIKIVDGQAKVEPVLMQSDKVTVTAQGAVDLRTEEITFDFNTRPRKGIGISPGMFTNPFIKLDGTLANPRVAVGAKGAVSGALAVGTGGLSVVAKGLVDRMVGEADLCPSTLAEVSGSLQATKTPGEGQGDQK